MITVDEDGEKKIEMDPTMVSDGQGTIFVDETGTVRWLEPPVVVSFSKVDDKGNMLEGATLRVEDTEGNVVIPEWISTDEPYVSEGELVIGHTYRLVEVKAPDGYAVANPIEFTVTDDKVKPDENKVITISMTDVKITKIVPPDTSIKTGDDTPIIPYVLFAMFGFAGLISTAALKLRDRKKLKEKINN
jgi:hypothetical protein